LVVLMIELPIDARLGEILGVVRGHSGVVLVAAPGAGKTTRVAPAIVGAGILPKEAPHVVMLQPRRVAARAAAERIAAEQGWQVGREVGYHIRFEKRYGAGTRVRVLTEAILTRMLLEDPYLDGIGCVILDEFHERNLHTDLGLAFLREIQQTVRPELKVVVMSATLDAGPVARFLGDVPVVEVAGRTFPVEVLYRPGRDVRLEEQVGAVVTEALGQEGDVLVFLPGVGEIERARGAVMRRVGEGVAVLALHGSLSADEQRRALTADGEGRRKVILATNIAETSLTIPGVRAVVDSGLARVASFDADRGMDRLDLERISQASATQRAGRAGREAAGRAYRLWSEQEHKHLSAYTAPEVERVDLASALLAVHAWGSEPRAFGWFEKPPEERMEAAERLLGLLGATEAKGISGVGQAMMRFPTHPRVARMLLAAAGTKLEGEALTLAASLSEGAPGGGDPLRPRLSVQGEKIRQQLAGIVGGVERGGGLVAVEDVGDLLLLAYPDRVARRRENDPHAAVMVGGTGLRLSAEALTPAVARAKLLVALDPHHDPRNKRAEAMVRTAVAVEEAALARLFPEEMRSATALEYDTEKEKVVAFSRRYFNDLLLHEDPHGAVDRERAGVVLAAALTPRARELFVRNPVAGKLLARAALVRHYAGGEEWPAFDDEQLAGLLAEACAGKRSLAEVTEGGALAESLRGALVYPLDRQLNVLAPETLEVPSGSHIRIEYGLPASDGAPPPAPVLAVRLQELFGMLETPRIVGGRVPLLLHLLSPGYKPIQITQDLRSFWSSAYFEVRKDLRTRYPKHKWPEDPLTAVPEAKGRSHRR
jgi:ATP-dependent helicase HrpB